MEPFVVKGSFPFPGKCATCGTSRGTGIDLGVDYPEVMFTDPERRGAVIICIDCVKLLAQKLDITAPVEEVVRRAFTQEQIDEIKDNIKDDMASLNDLLVPLLPPNPERDSIKSDEEAKTGGLDSTAGQGDDTSVEQDTDGVSSDSSDELFSTLLSGK